MIDYDTIKPLSVHEQNKIKRYFEKPIERSMKAMKRFLIEHFRYDTMNSCNRSTSYAHCIKINHIPFPPDINNSDELWSMMHMDDWVNQMTIMIDDFDEMYNHEWQVGTNGRSNGYLVLYQGKDNRSCYPGKSTDMDEDFHEWDKDALQDRCKLIRDFDRLCSDIAIEYASWVRTFDIKDQIITVPKTIQVLAMKS